MTDHVLQNRALWDNRHSTWFGERAQRQWAAEPHWGIWQIPQSELPVFPDNLAGKDLVDLGCGTAYIDAWAFRLGARPVGIDNSAAQLATARAMQNEFDIHFPLIHASAEQVPLRDASFDIAISEHGAAGWCDPYVWIPEAARLLRPGGELIFMRNSTLLQLCMPDDGSPAGPTLRNTQFGLHRLADPDGGAVNFALPTGKMIRLLRDSGFIVEDLLEPQAPAGATSEFDYSDYEWSRRWPSCEVWKARRTPAAGCSE
jgi:SAM-dependent methyltransferase